MENIPLTELAGNKTAVVKEIRGGDEAVRRLDSMGIRPGKSIIKIGAHFWKGPVTVMIDKARVAIGHSMAEKIIVEI